MAGRVSPYGFLMAGFAPVDDPAWRNPQARQAYWAEAARVGEKAWKAARARGLDKDGRPMAAIHSWTAEDRDRNISPITGKRPYSTRGRASSKNPPLQATGARSRTIALLRWEARDDGVWFYWDHDPDTGHDWGEILDRHGHGFTQRFYRGTGFVKARNVIGMSPQERAEVAAHMAPWWARNRGRWAIASATPPGAATRAAAAALAASKIPPTPAGAAATRRGPVAGLLNRAVQKLMARVGLANVR